MAAATASSRMIAKLIEGLCLLGAEHERLIAGARLSPQLVASLDGRVPHEQVMALLDEADRALGGGAIGLRLAVLAHLSPDNVLHIAIQSSRSVAEAFARTIRYLRILHDGVEMQMLEERELARLRYGNRHGEHRHGVEFALGLALDFTRRATRGAFTVERVAFVHAEPPSLDEHRRFFAAPIQFAQPHNELVFARRSLALPLREADPQLASHLDQHLEVVLSALARPDSFVEQVHRAVGADLRGGLPRMEDVARRLHMSTRTLQRRLRQSGTSFQNVLLEVRRDVSRRYLRETEMSISEIAFLVGFSEVSTFHRAFKHWTGATPASFRRTAAAG